MPVKKKPAKKKVARKVSVPPTDAGAVARRAPRTSVGQDVVEGDVDLEEEVEEEDEVVADGNRPAEIVRRALEVGLLEEDESVERWFTDTREAGDLAHGVHGVVVVRLALGEEDIKGLPELPSSWQDLLLLDVNAQALGVIAVVDSRSVLAWPNADAMPHTLLLAALYEFVGERLLMVSISLSVGERDALFTTMNASLRKRVAKTLTHKYAVLNDGTLFPNPVASDVDSICRTDSFVRYMGCASDEWNEHGPIQCVPPPLSVNYHPDCSTPYVYATAAESFALGYGAPTPFFCDMPLPSNQLLPDAPVEHVHGFALAGYFIERHSFDAVIGEAILNVDIAPRDWEVITLEDDTYASANVIRKQTKRSSKWLPEELRTQVLGAVTRIEGVEWSALKPVDLKLLHCTPCAPWDGYQLVHSDHNLMGPPWMKDCIQVFIPLDNVPPECALQVGVGSHQVGQHESNRWDVCSMELGDILLLKGCTFHRGAGGGEKGRYTLFIPFVPLEHAATMSKVHLARQLYALPPMVQFLKDAKGVPILWESFTHFSAPLLVRRRQAIPYCGDVVILGHGVHGATFFFKCPPGPEEPPCPLARFHRWYLPKASFDGGTRFTVEKGSLVFTFATCGYVLRRDEDGPEWMEWAAMGHALHVAPASVAEAVEQNWVVQRPTATGGMAYSCGCMDHCDNYGEVCISCACGTYAPRACCASASYALRFWCVRVDLPTRTRRPHRSYVLG